MKPSRAKGLAFIIIAVFLISTGETWPVKLVRHHKACDSSRGPHDRRGISTSYVTRSHPEKREIREIELFQGDIVMTPEISEALNKSNNDSIVLPSLEYPTPPKIAKRFPAPPKIVKRAILARKSELMWPIINGLVEVPYVLEDSITDVMKTEIIKAMDHWTQHVPCVKFIARNKQIDYLSFFVGKGCYSSVGRIGYKQRISIGADCVHMGIIAHEIAHALGFWHEQSRPDRDDYITVLWENVDPGQEDEFKKILGGALDSRGVPYDIDSLMHYGPHAFGKTKTSITLETKGGKTDFGQRRGLSDGDILQAKLMYCSGCPETDKMPVECPYYKDQGYCQSSDYLTFMDLNCERTCKCKACEDNRFNCDAFKRMEHCTKEDLKGWMKINCKKSCGYCS